MPFKLARRLSTVIAFTAILSGCGVSAVTPAKVGTSISANRYDPARQRIRAWMRPGSTGGNLLYTQGYLPSTGTATIVLTYPQGQLVGTINIDTPGLCSDNQGNVYLTYRNSVIEYAHGGTQPIRTVHIPGAEMGNCAVDPTSGNLAATFSCPPCGYQNLAIFPPGSDDATRYEAPLASKVGYDNKGNLFLADFDVGNEIAELPGDSSQFQTIALDQSIGEIGSIQWDGKYITVQDLRAPVTISRIAISGSVGTVVSRSKFGPYMRDASYSWIAGDGTVTFPFSTHGDEPNKLGIWKYPKGAHPAHTIKKFGVGGHFFGAVTVSLAPSSAQPRR